MNKSETYVKTHPNTLDLTGQTFGEWKVLGYKGKSMWECQCSCGTIRDIASESLRLTISKSCGHDTKNAYNILGKTFGDWKVIEHAEFKNNRHYWKCECSCGSVAIKDAYTLTSGHSKSCGHSRLVNMEGKVFGELTVLNYTGEKELFDYIQSLLPDTEIKSKYRKIKGITELDIYIPEKKIDIGFNGTYWHSSIFKEATYHQQKTTDCAKQGIRLIHIFEYEWIDKDRKQKVKQYLSDALTAKQAIFGRNTVIKEIGNKESKEFLNQYHLQGSVSALVKIGLTYNNELIAVMTIGKPRFNN